MSAGIVLNAVPVPTFTQKTTSGSRSWNILPDLRPMSDTANEQNALSARLVKYYLQSLARELLPSEKVAKCARAIRPNKDHVEVIHVPNGNKAYYRNLIICGRFWACPVCAAKIAEHRRHELAMLIYTAPYRPILVTYTLSHRMQDALPRLVTALQNALRTLKAGRGYQEIKALYGVVGSVRGYEVTYGRHGWHPHIHEILMIRQDTTDSEVMALEAALSERWLAALKKEKRFAGKDAGCKITMHDGAIAEYIAKYGYEPNGQGWTITHEIAKSTQKKARDEGMTPFDLLRSYGEGKAGDGWRFKQYVQTMKNIHPLHWSAGLRALLGATSPESSDEQVANNDPDEFIIMANLERDAWKLILKSDLRAELLNIASTGDKVAVIAWLARHGLKHVDLSEV
jgi:hypothetical protein